MNRYSATPRGTSAAVDLKSDCDTVLRVGKRNAAELRGRHCEVQWVDNHEEQPGYFPFEAQRAKTRVDPRAALWGTVQVNQQTGESQIRRGAKVEFLVCKRQPQYDGSVSIESARAQGGAAVDGDPRVPFRIEPEGPMPAETEASAQRSRGRCLGV